MKFKRLILIAIPSTALLLAPVLLVAGEKPNLSKANKNSIYTLTFSKDLNHHNYTYSTLSKEITAKNYLDNDITFKYNHMINYDNGVAIMRPGAEFYNPFVGSSPNYNALDGLKSIRVFYDESTYGDLYLSYGVDENYTTKKVLLESGVTYTFDNSYRPSHFKLTASPDEILDKYSIAVQSIEFTYSSYTYYTEGEETYSTYTIKEKCGKATIASGESHTFNLGNIDISTNNYLIIKYHANGYLKGTINYTKSGTSTTYAEEFFITPDQEEFRTFLDAFRRGAAGSFAKVINSITFSNPSDNPVTVYLNKVMYGDRTFSRTDLKTLSTGGVKLDISLKMGGAIAGVYDTTHQTVEYYNSSGEIKIRCQNDIDETITKQIVTTPNLINVYDLGREIQQSYYYNVDEENGYTPGQYGGKDNQYNPVQAGDMNAYDSKIVDYFATSSKIWVKVQAIDWAKTGSLTKSYMTNTYEIKDGLIYVDNSFVNWYDFTNYKENMPTGNYGPATAGTKYWALQELPAVYISHPLNYYSSVFDNYEIYDKNQGWNMDSTAVESVTNAELVLNPDGTTYSSSKTAGSYHYSFRKHYDDWLGYLNEDKFGLAIYMPAQKYNTDSWPYRHVYISGNYRTDHTYDDEYNRTYLNDDFEAVTMTKYSFKKNPFSSSRANNCNYFNTTLGFYPSEFTTINWKYAIGVDYIDNLKTKFKTIKDNNEIYNDFTIWKGATI